MKRILVVFHSQQYGNTKILAEAVAEGVRRAGAEARLLNTHEQRVGLADYLDADAIALGTPDYYSYPAGTIKTLFDDLYLWDKEGQAIKGKPALLFFTHGGGGRVRQPFEAFALRFFAQVGETIEGRRPIDEATKERCRTAGESLVRALGTKD